MVFIVASLVDESYKHFAFGCKYSNIFQITDGFYPINDEEDF